MDRDDAAERFVRGVDRGKPDQVGVVVFVVVGRGQFFARDVEFDAVERSASSRVATPLSVATR